MSTPYSSNDYDAADSLFHDTASDPEWEGGPQRPDTDPDPTPAPTPATLPRPTGPSWSTIALGLIATVVAGGALFLEFTDTELDWQRLGPLAVVGLGVLLVLVGLAALMRRNDDEGEQQG